MTMKGVCLLLLCVVVVQARNGPESRNPQPRAWEKGKVPESVKRPPSPGKIPQSSGSNTPKVEPKAFYHYTDKQGYEGIRDSHVIIQSSAGDFGTGVFLTTKEPTEGKQAVAEACWGNGADSMLRRGKVDYVFRIYIKVNEVGDLLKMVNRNVWVYKASMGESFFHYQVAKVPDQKGGKVTWGSRV